MRRVEAPEEVAGRYHLAGRIGAGGMGEVFRARDSVLGRTVALKMLPFELAVQPGFIERFRAEAQAAARISHPGVVQVHDWGQEDDTYYMVMEYVRGKNLRHILSVVGKLQPRQSAQVAGQVLGALSAAHERGLVHRDIKPENIIVGTDGRVKVTDFGIARAFENASMTGGLLGTVAYVAPEQARGEPVDPRADIYSTGCLLFELLTGSLPFEGDAAKVLQDHLNGRVPAPSTRDPAIGPGLDRVVLRATEPNPADRYQSAQEMRSDLAMAMRSLPDAPPLAELTSEFTSEVMPESLDTVVPGIRPKKKRRWWRWVLAALLVVGLTAAVWAFSPIKVPKVVGMRSQNAVATLRDKGLSVEQSRAFSDEIEDTVISTNPAPGRRVRRGGTVRITVSAGPQLTDAP
ncbi:MAG TPA: protein kinase, partial [Actinomycetota bacterium]|nr:protein kinase [Actinomycetota bacterium]